MTGYLLEVTGVTKKFGGLVALRDAGLSVREGSIHGLIGPNGAGKTTLFNIVSGFLRPDAGSVRFDGTQVTGLPGHRIASMGLIRTFQGVKPLVGLTALENVIAGAFRVTRGGMLAALLRTPAAWRQEAGSRERAIELLRRVGLAAVADTPASRLSFGELRFLEVARALAAEPRLLMLDEPAAGLNREEADRLCDVLKVLGQGGLTALVIEHDVELVFSACESVTVLDFGRVIADGGPAAIRQDPAVIGAYLGVQGASAAC